MQSASASRRFRRRVLVAAVAPVLAAAVSVRAGGVFDGDQLPFGGIRLWDVGGVTPGLNWDLNTLPVPGVDAITLDYSGDGVVDLNGVTRPQTGLTFKDWESYSLMDGTFGLTGAAPTILVGATVSSTYGSDYFADGPSIGTSGFPAGGLDLGPAAQVNSILFTHTDTGNLRLFSPITGFGSLSISRVAGGSNTRGVYFDTPNGGYSGPVTLGTGTAARLLGPGRTGTGSISLASGELDILSDVGGQIVTNKISSVAGKIAADHNYTAGPTPAYAPGVLHVLGTPAVGLTVDNPTSMGGTNDASLTFSANNGYNFGAYSLTISNSGGVAVVGSRTVEVDNGFRTAGYAGSVLQTSANRLNEQVVTATIGPPGTAVPSIFDFNIVTATGIPLVKTGTGVLVIEGPNGASSTGAKLIAAGVARFNTGASYGPLAPGSVTLTGGPGPISAGMGVGYATPVAATPLATTGVIPGQSGAFDVDVPGGSAAPFVPAIGPTALRLGSSGTGTITGPISSYASGGTNFFYLGGGGGTLTIAGGFVPTLASPPAPDIFEMGTTGTLLPGRVNLSVPMGFGAAVSSVKIRAGTLSAGPVGFLAANSGVSNGTYSTTLGSDASYGGAPAATPFNGPGQLLLDAATQGGFGYSYLPGGSFGGLTGLTLDGGAIGYAALLGAPPPMVFIPAVPGTYGTTLASTLYGTMTGPIVPMATNILHFGGENSTETMVPAFPIGNNGAIPVALLKSGVDSVLDLTFAPAATYTGGTGILGGEVKVNMSSQLGPAAIVIADGGVLHVATGGPPVVAFPQILRVANGPNARASLISVDAGVVASFGAGTFEAAAPGSILEKTGGGELDLLPPAVYPSTAANTWGIKATSGTVLINQLPGITTPSNGSAVFDGGTLHLVGATEPGYIAVPVATMFSPSYGFSGIQTYAGTASTLLIGLPTLTGNFFRIDGAQTSSLMGGLDVEMGFKSVFKVAGNALGTDTRGTGFVKFNGPGDVQFTPGAGKILWPRDAAFSMTLDGMAHFSGCADTEFHGNLSLNPSFSPFVTIDGETVSNVPAVAADTWLVAGTGTTTWGGLVIKGQTEAIPGSGGPFTTGTVTFNRSLGGLVSISAASTLEVDYGTFNAGGTGDPFTDSTTAAHLPIINNANFNITAGTKDVASIFGAGTTTVSAGATLLVGSSGPVGQKFFTINGTADVGNADVSVVTGVGPSPALLKAIYVRGGALSIMSGTAIIKDNGTATGTSHLATLAIGVGGHLDIRDNHVVVTSTPTGTWNGVAYTDLQGLVASGRNGNILPLWDGTTGIITSETFATTSNYTTIGISKASDVRAATATATGVWSGQTITGTDTLIMYTYGGDATLDGKINIDDYIRIDSGIASGLTGWSNGDFNYDGKINIDDYTQFIDANIGTQGAPFPTSSGVPASTGAVVAVPEPATTMMMLLVGGGAAVAAANRSRFARKRHRRSR